MYLFIIYFSFIIQLIKYFIIQYLLNKVIHIKSNEWNQIEYI